MTNLNYSEKYRKLLNDTIGVSGNLDTTNEQRYIIGMALSGEKIRTKLLNILKSPSMFTTEHNQTIWSTILHMHRNGSPIEKITLKRELDKIDKSKYDLSIYDDIIERGSEAVAISEAELLYAEYCIRNIKQKTHEIYKSIDTISVKELQKTLINQMSDIENLIRMLPQKTLSNDELFEKAYESIEKPADIIPFPIKKMNIASGGMTRGHTTTIAARTGHGKTTTIVNLIDGWLKQGYKIRLYQREQKAEEIMQACILLNAKIDRLNVRKGKITDEDKRKVKEAIAYMRPFYENLIIKDDIDNMEDTITDIVSCSEKPDIVIDDFIQLIDASNEKAIRRFQIEDIMKTYHWLQKRYNFSTIIVSQLSRAVETRQFDNEPRLSDLAESSSIEQLSENVIMLWWEYKFLGDKSEYKPNAIKFIFNKVRFGNTGYKIIEIDEKTGKLDDN